jgi:hypothetical protein
MHVSKLAPLRRRVVYSPHLPFALRARLEWWADMKFRQPAGFNEHVRRRMKFDRRPIMRTFNDKVAVRGYIAKRLGPDVLKVQYVATDDPTSIDRRALPREFVVKPSHGSGATVIVSASVPVSAVALGPSRAWELVTVHPDELDWALLLRTCKVWLRTRYGAVNLAWGYKDVPPRVIVEEFLGPPIPLDFKLWTFHGVVRMISVTQDQFRSKVLDAYTPDWKRLDVQLAGKPNSEEPLPAPATLPTMLEYAERLGKGLEFLRVDLYDVDGRIMFGELTPYPGAGIRVHRPPTLDGELGHLWTRPQVPRTAAPPAPLLVE